MTEAQRRLLPLLNRPTGRSAMTCLYRCGNACSHPVPNRTENEYFGDIVAATVTRRGLLKSSAAVAVVVGTSGALQGTAAADIASAGELDSHGADGGSLTFVPVPPNTLDQVIVPQGYSDAVIIRWGEPVLPGAPNFHAREQTAEKQAKQFGYN